MGGVPALAAGTAGNGDASARGGTLDDATAGGAGAGGRGDDVHPVTRAAQLTPTMDASRRIERCGRCTSTSRKIPEWSLPGYRAELSCAKQRLTGQSLH